MNPSTADLLAAIESAHAPEVVILPNNHNILPVALQAADVAGKPVRVVPTNGIAEGFAALLEYDPQASAEENAKAMADSARRVVAGEVTRAVRDAASEVGPVRVGDWLGLSRDGVEVIADSVVDAVQGLLSKLACDHHELVTLIEGEGAGAADTRRITEWLSEQRPTLSVEIHHGGQPLYPYLVGIE
jgi:dihydroxyacetone kinase-like predicted kinase